MREKGDHDCVHMFTYSGYCFSPAIPHHKKRFFYLIFKSNSHGNETVLRQSERGKRMPPVLMEQSDQEWDVNRG